MNHKKKNSFCFYSVGGPTWRCWAAVGDVEFDADADADDDDALANDWAITNADCKSRKLFQFKS